MIDEYLHKIFKNRKSIRWRDFHEAGIEESYYDWYYAERRLYVIRDRLTEQLWFVEAGGPAEAYEEFNAMFKEVNGGDYEQMQIM